MYISPGTRKYLAKVVIAIEVGCLIGGYRVWHKMNTNQDYRKSVHENYPNVLEIFYYSAEKLAGNMDVRQNDYKTWGVVSEK